MNTTLKVGFSDFGRDEGAEGIFRNWAEERGAIIDQKAPDILIHSCWGVERLDIPARLKVSYTGENLYPNFNVDDYAVSQMRESCGGRNFYCPGAYLMLGSQGAEIKEEDARRKFAIFIASQDNMGDGARLRREFTQYVMDHYKPIDCPGKVLHNVDIPELQPRSGNWIAGKRQVVRSYKFNICFENSNSDGYITEKLMDAFVCHTVPIYWGSQGNIEPFPREAMIYANDYADFEALLARVREVDSDDEVYLRMLAANPLRDERFLAGIRDWRARLYDFLDMIAERVQGEDGLNLPSRGATRFDSVTYLERKLSDAHPWRKFFIKLIPVSSWRRALRRKYVKK